MKIQSEKVSKDLILVFAYAQSLGLYLSPSSDNEHFRIYSSRYLSVEPICEVNIYQNISSTASVFSPKYMKKLSKLISFIEETFDKKNGEKMEVVFY